MTRLQNGRYTVKNMTEPDFVVQERTALGKLYSCTFGLLSSINTLCPYVVVDSLDCNIRT